MPGTIVLATAADQPDITASDELYAAALRRRGFKVLGAAWNGPRAASRRGSGGRVALDLGLLPRGSPSSAPGRKPSRHRRACSIRSAWCRWNLRKDYVGKLATAGVRTPGTRIVARDAAMIEKVFDETGWQRAVVKPASGGGGHSVELLSRDTVADARAQGSLPATCWCRNSCPRSPTASCRWSTSTASSATPSASARPRASSAATRATVPTRAAETPAGEVAEQGAAALRALPEMPLYARVDGVVRGGALIVIEVEVLEPALFMEFDPPSAERFAEATAQAPALALLPRLVGEPSRRWRRGRCRSARLRSKPRHLLVGPFAHRCRIADQLLERRGSGDSRRRFIGRPRSGPCSPSPSPLKRWQAMHMRARNGRGRCGSDRPPARRRPRARPGQRFNGLSVTARARRGGRPSTRS